MDSKSVMTDDLLLEAPFEVKETLAPLDMAGISEEINLLLDGKSIGEGPIDVTNSIDNEFVPIVKQSVCYIVCGIVFNEHNEILMMQEAKASCRGMWYLPAGRMEANETIVEAVKREVLEETGIKFEPTTLICTEVASGFWYRFTFTGSVIGGKLKTEAEKDQESLQARWCSVETIKSGRSEFPLRSIDVIPLIDIAMNHKYSVEIHADILPALVPHTKLLLRMLFVHLTKDSNKPLILYGRKPITHIPTATISTHDTSLHNTLSRMATYLFGHCKFPPRLFGLLSIEHCGKPTKTCDGICFTLISTISTNEGDKPPIRNSHFEWIDLESDTLNKKLSSRLTVKTNLPLLLLR